MKEKKRGIIILLLILLALSIFFYGEKIYTFPSEIHAWTESDRLALAIGFYENGHQLFFPQTFEIETKNRITAVDFPIVEWLVSLVMQLAQNSNPFWFRSVHLLISFIGFVFLYRLVYRWSDSMYKSIISVLFVFTIPIITYYQAGFIPSIPSFSALLVGYFFYFRFLEKRKSNNDIYWAIFLLGLAALMRKSYLVFLIAVAGQEALFWINKKKINYQHLTAMLSMGAVFVGYFFYNQYLTETYGSRFLNHLCPPEDWLDFWRRSSEIFNIWSSQFMSLAHLSLFIIVAGLGGRQCLKKWTEYDTAIWTQIMISGCGALSFFIAMHRQFVAHEYYFIDSFYPVLFLVFCWAISKTHLTDRRWNIISACIGGIIIFIAIYQSKQIQKEKDAPVHWKRLTKVISDFQDSDKILDSLQIQKDATVLALEAYATNSVLLLMNRKGHTSRSNRIEKLKSALEIETDYVAISDMYLVSDIVTPYPDILKRLERIGGNSRFSIYRKLEKDYRDELKTFIGIEKKDILGQDSILFSSMIPDTLWQNIELDTLFGLSTVVRENQDYGLTYSKFFQGKVVDRFLVEGKFKSIQNDVALLSFFVKQNEKTLHYWEFPIMTYNEPLTKWQNLQFLFDIPKDITGNIRIDCFIWNKNRGELYTKEVVMTAIKEIH